MSNIQSVICRLGYEKSDNLYYLSNVNICEKLSWHDRRVINELSPYAVYVVDGNVLVAFFDDLHKRINTDIQCKIWNAQIPVIISDEGNWIKIYNGKSMQVSEKNKVCLSYIANYNMEECDEKNGFSYWNITNNISLGLYEKNLARKDLNDSLIENLRYITSELKEKYQISFANKLVLRILFVRYLIDRGICIGYKGLDSNVKKSQEIFLDIVKQKGDIFSLFIFLKEEFNGNLFEMDEEKEWQEISDSALVMLYDFLTAKTDMKTGQLWLFPFYDFNIIPIELISNIYEILLGKERQDKDKAFYTPEYLADYIIQRTVGKYLIDNNECTVFDPSCGSGIFLVKSLRRILEKNASKDGYIRDKEEINRLVKDNIYGVDYNEEAVDVTIFSLYVTLFDYQDPKKLKDFKLPLLKGHNILFGDFFDQDVIRPITNTRFKYIVGNPPWGRVQQERYKEYCKSKKVIPQDGEICVAFLLKVKDVGNENTECSLVIPSKILYKGKKPSCDFRKKLLSDVCMQQVLEISAVRKQIFKGAIAPAAVVSFVCKKAFGNHKVEYISLKPNRYLKMYGIIMIEPDDVKYIIQEQLLKYDWLWKVLVYGGYWDYELIKSLYKMNPLIAEVAKDYSLKMGKGIEDHVGDGQDASHLVGRKILLNIEGLLNSSLFTYLNFMLGSSVGIEREQIFLNELIKFPYVYSDKLVELVEKMHLAMQDNSAVEDIQVEINNCVFEMYGVQNNYFVDYALNVQIPMLCGKYVEAKCNATMLIQYAKVFLDVWRKRLERSNLRYSIKLYPNIKGKFAAFYMKLSFEAKNNDISVADDVEDNVKILTDFMIYKLNDCFYQTKNVAEFDDDAFVIVKPIDAKNWHGAMAMKDSYKVLNAVLLGEEDCQ